MIHGVSSNTMLTFLNALKGAAATRAASVPYLTKAGNSVKITAEKIAGSPGWYSVQKVVQKGDKTVTGHFTFDSKCNLGIGRLVPTGVITDTPRGQIVQRLTKGNFVTPNGYFSQIGKVHTNDGASFSFSGLITNPQNIIEIQNAPRGFLNGGRYGSTILMPEQLKNIVNYIRGLG